MKNYFLLLTYFLVVITTDIGYAQSTFHQLHDVEKGAVYPLNNGKYLVSGTINSEFGCLINLNTYGDSVWTKKYYTDSMNINFILAKESSDGSILCISQNVSFDGVKTNSLLKTDSTGNILWTKSFWFSSNDIIKDVIQTFDNGYVVIGSGNQNNIFIVKINNLGNLQWSKQFGHANYISAHSVIQNYDTGYSISGGYFIDGSNKGVFLLKLDSLGNSNWLKYFNGINIESSTASEASDGGIFLTANEVFPEPQDTFNISLLKVDILGNLIWCKQYANTMYKSKAAFACKTNDNNMVISGLCLTTSGFYSLLIKIDNNGVPFWSKLHGEPASQISLKNKYVRQCLDGGYLLSSYKIEGGFLPQIENLYLIKTDSEGNSGCYDHNVVFNDSLITLNSSSETFTNLFNINILNIPIYSANYNVVISKICNSSASTIEPYQEKGDIVVYPNPTQNFIYVNLNNEPKKSFFSLYNIEGQLVNVDIEQTTSFKYKVQMGNLQEGIYFLKISSEKGLLNKKIVLAK
jgi:hypothetical protein